MFDVDHLPVRTHRLSWELVNGPIPLGGQVLHSCDNPSCCNPAHLFLGTPKENARDKVSKGRQAVGAPGKQVAPGADHMLAKLTWDEARAIRVLRSEEGASISELAETFGVSERTVQSVLSNKSYLDEPTNPERTRNKNAGPGRPAESEKAL
jgi:DNA-binding transcriptional regulator YiaG